MVGFGSSKKSSQRSKQVVVGVGDMTIANEASAKLSTFALGSCVGIVIVDANNRVGGLLHVMLPSSSVSLEKSKTQPFLFADTGVPKFLSMLDSLGANLSKVKCVVAGGASAMTSNDAFRIGEKNADAVKEALCKHDITVDREFLGGFSNRSLHLALDNCILEVMEPSQTVEVNLS